MTTMIALSDGTLISPKDYSKLLFNQHSSIAQWLISAHSSRSHLVIEHSEFSPSICSQLFKTKDLFEVDQIDAIRPIKRCKRCVKAYESLDREGS